MKYSWVGLIILIVFLGFSFSYAQNNSSVKTTKQMGITKSPVVKGTMKFVNTVCLVSHKKIDPKYYAVYNGKAYGFCSNECLNKFKLAPAQYVAKFARESMQNLRN